ncbi:hypothetical protein CAJAP_08831 [Camponotus japonicus]
MGEPSLISNTYAMESQTPTTIFTKEAEEERQPSVASSGGTVIMAAESDERYCALTKEAETVDRQSSTASTVGTAILADDHALSQESSPFRSVTVDSADVSDVATMGDERLTVPSSDDSASFSQTDTVDQLLNAECSVTLECLVDPSQIVHSISVEFPSVNMDVDADDSLDHIVDGQIAPKTKEFQLTKTSSNITASGKRRRCRDASESDDSDYHPGPVHPREGLRPRKARIIENTTTEEGKAPQPTLAEIPTSIVEVTTGEAEDSQITDVDSTGQPKKKKQTKKRGSPIASRMHSIIDSDNIPEQSLPSLAVLAMDWVDDIDVIRVRSNTQGVISKMIKQRLELLREIFRHFHNQELRPDNPHTLKIRNARFVSDIAALQKENEQLKSINHNLEKALKETRASFDVNKISKLTKDAETSPMVRPDQEKSSTIPEEIVAELSWIKQKILQLEARTGASDWEAPLPQRPPRATRPIIKSIVDLSPTRKVTIKTPTCGGSPSGDPPDTSRDVSVRSPSPPGPGSYASVLGSRVSPSLLDPGSSAPETERKEISKSGEIREISSYSHASVLGSGASPSLDPRSSAPETKRKDVSKSREKGGKEESKEKRIKGGK